MNNYLFNFYLNSEGLNFILLRMEINLQDLNLSESTLLKIILSIFGLTFSLNLLEYKFTKFH